MKTEMEVKDSAIKDYIEMRGRESRKDFYTIFMSVFCFILILVACAILLKVTGIIPSVPVELKTCITRQILA